MGEIRTFLSQEIAVPRNVKLTVAPKAVPEVWCALRVPDRAGVLPPDEDELVLRHDQRHRHFRTLVAAHHQRLRAVVLIGRDRQLLADALARHAPDVPVVDVGTPDTGAMSQVVQHAAALARPGDTVLLAPSAASWDMFRDYAQRGELFAEAVRQLAEQT